MTKENTAKSTASEAIPDPKVTAPNTPSENPYKRDFAISEEFKQKYTIKRQGQDVVLVKGLMHLAHARGFRGMKSRFVQFPCQDNNFTAFAETEVIDEFGRVWCNGGDANEGNVGKQVAPHFARMALTRSQGRALRDALGLQLLVDEELEVMVQTAQSMGAPITQEQVDSLRELRTRKGKDRTWVVSTCATIFDKQVGDITEKEAFMLLFLLDELPDAAVVV
jgi:hypothetical protein